MRGPRSLLRHRGARSVGRCTAALLAIGGAAVVAGCAAGGGGPVPEAGAPTLAELGSATWTGIEPQPITLVDGVWEGEPYAAGGASRPRVTLATDFRVTGDLDDDGRDEAIVLLAASAAGSGTRNFLGAAGWDETGALRILGTGRLGDRVQVRGARVTDGRIEVDVVQPGPGDAACCPGDTARRWFRVRPDGLEEVAAEVTGRLSLDDLEGVEWVLSGFGPDEPAPVAPEVTLQVEGGRVSGASGCNRYTAAVAPGAAPGEIAIGPVAGTRRACPTPEMQLEDRVLAALSHAGKFGFLAGQLALTWRDGDAVGTLRFAPRPLPPSSGSPGPQGVPSGAQQK